MNTALQQLRSQLNAQFPERREVIDGSLCAVLAGEHVLLLGPPGTAKSALVRAIAQAFSGSYFERLLTKFTTPEELFGPISLKALEQDRFLRVTTGRLPEAQFAFVDEVFKSSSAILNSLLTLLNERTYANDGAPLACPLVSLFGASNELPEGKELEALWDRFALRFEVHYLLRPANLRVVLTTPEPTLPIASSIADLKTAQTEVEKVLVTDDTIESLLSIRDALKQEGIVASDRRWKKSIKLLKATAFLSGATETSPEDLTALVDAVWREPKDRPRVARIIGKLSDPVAFQAREILDAARETATKVQALKSSDRKAYLAQAAQSLEEFRAQQTKLTELGRSGGRRAKEVVADATAEVNGLHADLARTVSTGLGLGMRAVK